MERELRDVHAATASKRPTNGFMLFSNAYRSRIQSVMGEDSNQSVSRVLWSIWMLLPVEVRELYEEQASKLSEESSRKNPYSHRSRRHSISSSGSEEAVELPRNLCIAISRLSPTLQFLAADIASSGSLPQLSSMPVPHVSLSSDPAPVSLSSPSTRSVAFIPVPPDAQVENASGSGQLSISGGRHPRDSRETASSASSGTTSRMRQVVVHHASGTSSTAFISEQTIRGSREVSPKKSAEPMSSEVNRSISMGKQGSLGEESPQQRSGASVPEEESSHSRRGGIKIKDLLS